MATSYTYTPGSVLIGQQVNNNQASFTKKTTFFNGIAAAGLVPTITLTSNAGSSATVTSQAGYDWATSFVYTAGTTATVAGTLATVVFGQQLSAAPVSVVMSAANTTAGATTNLTAGALNVTKSGFSIYVASSALTSATYLINYQVVKSPF